MTTDVVVAIVMGAFALITALGVAIIQRNDRIAKDVLATRDQVQDIRHTSSLRDDIDALHETVRVTLRAVEGLHEEIRHERRERMALAARLGGHIESVAETLSEHLTDPALRALLDAYGPSSNPPEEGE